MKISIFLLFLAALLFMSCQTEKARARAQRRWYDKGIQEHWIDSLKVNIDTSFSLDTGKINNLVDDYIKSVQDSLAALKKKTGNSPCDSLGELRPETIEVIRWKTKKEFVPKIVEVPFADTLKLNQNGVSVSVWYDPEAKEVKLSAECKNDIIHCPPVLPITAWQAIKELWWVIVLLLLIIAFQFIVK